MKRLRERLDDDAVGRRVSLDIVDVQFGVFLLGRRYFEFKAAAPLLPGEQSDNHLSTEV